MSRQRSGVGRTLPFDNGFKSGIAEYGHRVRVPAVILAASTAVSGLTLTVGGVVVLIIVAAAAVVCSFLVLGEAWSIAMGWVAGSGLSLVWSVLKALFWLLLIVAALVQVAGVPLLGR